MTPARRPGTASRRPRSSRRDRATGRAETTPVATTSSAGRAGRSSTSRWPPAICDASAVAAGPACVSSSSVARAIAGCSRPAVSTDPGSKTPDPRHQFVLEDVIGRDAARHTEQACALDGAAARGDHGTRGVSPGWQQPERQRRFGHQPRLVPSFADGRVDRSRGQATCPSPLLRR